MDWSWRCTELATTVTGSEPIRLPCVGYIKTMVYAHKVNTRKELLQRILSAARSINNAALLPKVTSSLVTPVRKCIQANGGHFEQLAWVFNGEFVTVHLTTYLNRCTMLLFLLWFIYCTLRTRNSETVANWTHMYMTFWLSISSGIKSRSSDLNTWYNLYISLVRSLKSWSRKLEFFLPALYRYPPKN